MRKLLVLLSCLLIYGCGQSAAPDVAINPDDECRFLTLAQANELFGSVARADLHSKTRIANVYTGYDCSYAVDKVYNPDRRVVGYELKLARDLAQATKLYEKARQEASLNAVGAVTPIESFADHAFMIEPKAPHPDGRIEKLTAQLYLIKGNSFLVITYTYPQGVDRTPLLMLKRTAEMVLAKISA